MSLFGGELSASPSPDRSSTAPPSERSPTPPNAQRPPLVSLALDSDEGDEYDDDDESDEPDDGLSRPNRYTGRPDKWHNYTRAERQIAASLEKLESEDLAAHLYNAHNLKRRVRKPKERLARITNFQPKSSWLKKGQELEFVDPFGETQTELVPGRAWTAWPVPPELMLTKSAGVGRADSEEDTWYIEDAGAQDVGEVMREEVLALLLKQAKETWSAREFEPVGETVAGRSTNLAGSDTENEGPSRSASVRSHSAMQDMKDDVKNAAQTSASELEEKFSGMAKRRGHQPEPQPVETAFLADDDEARRIMQPSIDSLLARVDDLALAIRRSRANHFGHGVYSNPSGSEFTSEAETVNLTSRSQSRARSRSQAYKETKAKGPLSQHTSANDSDSGSEYNSDNASPDPSQSSRQGRAVDSSERHNTREISKQYSLMDWSEVLGIASVIGWDQGAVARAAQRCAVLFDEGMSFRTFDESRTRERIPSPVRYEPATIPPLDPTDLAPPRRPYFEVGTLRCPHKDCKGSERDFPIPYRVIEHVMRVHGYDPRTNDSDNEDRKVGGVHIDGFLQPIGAKQGWLGGGRVKRGKKKVDAKKQKVEDQEDSL